MISVNVEAGIMERLFVDIGGKKTPAVVGLTAY